MQEEIRRNTRDGSSSKTNDEENYALSSKARKGKGKAFHSKSDSCHGGKKKYMVKFKCFHCHKLGHFATNCPLKKSKKTSLEGAVGEALASQFKLEFTLIVCMVSSTMGSVWHLDSEASFHMTGDKEFFNDLEEKDIQMHNERGDDGRYSAIEFYMVIFQRDKGDPLTLRDVMHVPGLNKNLVSVTMFM